MCGGVVLLEAAAWSLGWRVLEGRASDKSETHGPAANKKTSTIGTLIITYTVAYTILGVPCYNYSMIYPRVLF